METKYTQKIVAKKLEELKQKQEVHLDIGKRELAKQIDIPSRVFLTYCRMVTTGYFCPSSHHPISRT